MQTSQTIGILGAIPQEIDGIIATLTSVRTSTIGGRTYSEGLLGETKVVVVYSRIGKVAAAATVATLLLNYHVNKVIFIGVAGGIHEKVNVGDVVVAETLVQYDMDASPLRPKFEIPLLGKAFFSADTAWAAQAIKMAQEVIAKENLQTLITAEELTNFKIHQPKVHYGIIASGDQFFSTIAQKENLQRELPEVLCVEMEGAAVAQVCYEFAIPFLVIRTISDKADQEASFSFQSFVERISLVYGQEIMKRLFP